MKLSGSVCRTVTLLLVYSCILLSTQFSLRTKAEEATSIIEDKGIFFATDTDVRGVDNEEGEENYGYPVTDMSFIENKVLIRGESYNFNYYNYKNGYSSYYFNILIYDPNGYNVGALSNRNYYVDSNSGGMNGGFTLQLSKSNCPVGKYKISAVYFTGESLDSNIIHRDDAYFYLQDSEGDYTNVTFGKTYTDYLEADEVKWYKFTIPQTGKLTINADYFVDDRYSWVYIYEEDMVSEVKFDQVLYNSNLGHCTLRNRDFYLLAGTYYVLHKDYKGGYTGTKKLNMRFDYKPLNETYKESYNDRYDNMSTAKKAVAGKLYSGVLKHENGVWSQDDNRDYFKIVLNKKTKINLSVSANLESAYFIIYDKNGNEIWRDTLLYYYDEVKKNHTITLNKGTYYISASCYNYCEVLLYKFKYSVPSSKPDDPVPDKPTAKSINMYRLYNPNSGEHFYTASAAERDELEIYGWYYEGIAWKAPKKSNTSVYRLYNPNSGDHHYTTSVTERNSLVSVGWSYEGVGWYSDDNRGVALFRLYNPNAFAGSHHYTTSRSERNNLVRSGWKYEGIAWYGLK